MKIKDKIPYIYGALTGLVMVLSVVISGKFFGASTTFARSGGYLESLMFSERVMNNPYFQKYVAKMDWQFFFVIGIVIGAFLSSYFSGEFKKKWIPEMWKEEKGENIKKRALWAFLGGILVIFGARMAGGCPSGHGLSGLAQLSVSGYLALISFFAGGVISAKLMYKGGKK